MDFHIVKCLECGFIYVNPIDTDYTFSLYRGSEGPSVGELYHDQFEQKRKINKFLLDILKSRLARDKRILYVGCGTGAFMVYIKSYFYNIFGIDTSKREVAYAQSLGLNIVEGCAELIDTL